MPVNGAKSKTGWVTRFQRPSWICERKRGRVGKGARERERERKRERERERERERGKKKGRRKKERKGQGDVLPTACSSVSPLPPSHGPII